MDVQHPTNGAGRRLLRVAAVALVAIAVGPVGVAMAEPPAPEQLKVYEAAAATGSVASDPAVAIEPDQPPEAVHELASVEDQVSVTGEPEAILEALEVKVTVGAGADDSGAGLPPSLPPQQAASSKAALANKEATTGVCIAGLLPGRGWRDHSSTHFVAAKLAFARPDSEPESRKPHQ